MIKKKTKTKNNNHDRRMLAPASLGQKIAEKFSRLIGSWTFIFAQTMIIIIWAILNGIVYWLKWDPYPFIFLNLLLSISAAYAAPIILMSQNREIERDRIRMINDLAATRKAEREVEAVQRTLNRLEKKINAIAKKG